jgi:hypothetical protein
MCKSPEYTNVLSHDEKKGTNTSKKKLAQCIRAPLTSAERCFEKVNSTTARKRIQLSHRGLSRQYAKRKILYTMVQCTWLCIFAYILLIFANNNYYFLVPFLIFVWTIYLKSLIWCVNNCVAYHKRIKICIEPYELLYLAFKIQCKIGKKSSFDIEGIITKKARYALMSTKDSRKIKCYLLNTDLKV